MNNEELREEELLALQKAMQEDAEEIEIPESLSPEAMKKKLEEQKCTTKGKVLPMRRFAEVAAACAVLIIGVGVGGNFLVHKNDNVKITPVLVGDTYTGQYQHEENVGDMYVLAQNYDEVYERFTYQQKYIEYDRSWNEFTLSGNKKGDGGINYGSGYIVEEAEMSNGDMAPASTGTSSANDYSTTNLQVQGVDESDIVKTDGKYIYIVNDNCVTIVDIQGKEMKEVCTIHPDMRASDCIRELYVDGDRIYIITETSKTNLRKSADDTSADRMLVTVLFTYDTSDITSAKLIGQAEVEGQFKESRKVGEYVYLFTTRNLWITEDEKNQVIPYVQQQLFPEDCIYVRESGRCELIMVSVDVNAPSEVVDQVMVVNDNASVYVGTENIYLYNQAYYDYTSGGTVTEIAKFSYKNGHINAVGANSVKGTVEDTFAVSEKNGYFRILTTEWSSGRSNNLYVFDQNMKLVGQLDDIAPNESIYAARYVGDYVYFITYRNMDPLFIVDMSNPTKPVILSELEISGFSDYLQMYGSNRLLGIGYETDQYSTRLGGKLVMFNVEDPANPVIQSVKVDDGMNNIPGTYNYKQILADPDKNLIGFVYDSYSRYTPHYVIYQYHNGEFEKILDVEMEGEWNEDAIRGLYAGSRYYIIGSSTIQSYDMDNAFEEIDLLTY